MIEKNGIVTFECDKDKNGNEILNSSQRNNEIIWPPKETFPKSQYYATFKNCCNTTSYVMALEYSGFKFPSGKFKQPEDNLTYHILTSKAIMESYKKSQPVMYNNFVKCLNGTCNKQELQNMCFPNEIHKYLCMGANEWLGTEAASFNTNVNFKKALWKFMVKDSLPIVISTIFGGMNHIVCATGVQYKKEDWLKGVELEKSKGILPEITPISILVDDPWGKYNPKTNKYDAPNNGNDIVIPWDVVIERVKPCNSDTIKWGHTFTHGIAII